ncbi:hypothetical protein [Mycobacterium sp. URHB0044]|jgi:hypothetical protein|uniref:hypothetical protein n=1 Tax=Mycobacterium sp. URHB0044 TaxID=1380386 RepID=UPI00048C1783|nr:hypothetical protein [Mycobacterium sp. URHB0044]
MTLNLTNVDLSAEGESYSHPEPGQEFWQQNGYTFVGSSDGMDFLLWTRICIISGREGGQWLHTGQTVEHATTLIMVPSERRGALSEHTFIANGAQAAQLRARSDLTIVADDEAVSWSIGGRVYKATPDMWHIRGEHAGVDLDLTFTPTHPPLWPWGKSDDAAVVPIWYDVMSEVAGTITVDGKPYTFAAHGIREHMTVGKETNNIGNNAPYDPIYWNWLINPDISVWFFRYPGPGLDLGFVRVDGEDIAYASGQITNTVVEHWSDRRSGLSLPCKWNLVLASGRGTLVLDIAAHGRAFFPWVQVLGVRLEIWMLCSASGTFHHADGKVTVIDEQLMCVNPLQFLTYAEESTSGKIGALPS